MLNNKLFIIAGFIIVTLCGWGIWEWTQSGTPEIATQMADASEAPAARTYPQQDSGAQFNPQPLSNSSFDTLPAQQPTPANSDKNLNAKLNDLMQDPTMRNMMDNQIRTTLDMMYGELYEDLHLKPEQKKALADLLAERTMGMMDMGLSAMSNPNLSEAEQQDQVAAIQAKAEESEHAIRHMLGAEGYKKYEHYEDTNMARQQVKTMAEQLERRGKGLSKARQKEIVETLFEQSNKRQSLRDLNDRKNFDPSKLTADNLKSAKADVQEVVKETARLRGLSPEATEELNRSAMQAFGVYELIGQMQ